MKFFDLDSPLMKGMTRVGETVVLNLLFLLMCLPVVTAGASLSAMYTVCFRNLENKPDELWDTFWKAFKANFRKATLLWLIVLVTGGLIAFNLFVYSRNPGAGSGLRIMSLVAAILFVLVTAYIFPLEARYENTVGRTLRNAVWLSVGKFPVTLLLAVMNIVPLAVAVIDFSLFLYLGILWIAAWFALVARLSCRLLLKVFKKIEGDDAAAEATPEPDTTEADTVAYFTALSQNKEEK